ENGPVRKDGLSLADNGRRREFGIRVVPLRLPVQYKEHCYAIFFEDASRSIPPEARTTKGSQKPGKKKKLTAGERKQIPGAEASENQKYQQALIEEYETTQEELTAANEELQSTNEELQSTNEELETAKEELQSANEEMTTVNDELQ